MTRKVDLSCFICYNIHMCIKEKEVYTEADVMDAVDRGYAAGTWNIQGLINVGHLRPLSRYDDLMFSRRQVARMLLKFGCEEDRAWATRVKQEAPKIYRAPYQSGRRLSGGPWTAIRMKVFQRDNHTCQYCGVKGGRLECDHILPVARGGSHKMNNLATACFSCNRSKHDKTPEEWERH